MKKILTLALFAAMFALSAASCTKETAPQPGENGLDPELVPEQDADLYPGESADLEFAVSDIFGDNMVIQQNRELKIWGQGKTGDEVKVTVSWSSKTFTNKVDGRGQWRIRVNVPLASKFPNSQNIVVESGSFRRNITRILIGEVWICGGQSNMQMPVGPGGGLSGVENYASVISEADSYSKIRMYTAELRTADTPQWNCTGTGWTVCSSSTCPSFSAVAYFFGKTLHNKLRVPIGLIVNPYGGATAQAYTPIKALDADPDLRARYTDPYRANPGAYNPMTIPGGLWNAMVYPFLNCSARGMIWYQGEGNWPDYDVYPALMRTLVREWREGFGVKASDFPHYYVQIAGYYFEKKEEERIRLWDVYSYIREAQAKIRRQVANSEMVTTMDVGDPDDIHPAKKREVGERLANIALNRDYGYGDIDYLGPRYKSHEINGGTVTVSFDYAEGLRTDNGAAPKLFYIAGEDKKFFLADAVIDGDKVVLTNSSVPQPVAVRYAFISAPVTNLMNAYGLPAEPFRTDEWPSVTYNRADQHTQKPY